MKKMVMGLLCVLMFVSVMLFANGVQEKTSGPIELVYWSHYGHSPVSVQAFAEAVNLAAKNLGYDQVTCRAEVIEYSGYEAKYLTGFASDNGPDFFLGRTSDWALNGGANPIALPLREDVRIAWDEGLAPMFSDSGMFNEERYGFPVEGGSLQMLYINTDHMVEAGLNPEKDMPRTLEELTELAKKLTKYDTSGKIVRSGFQPRYLGTGDGVASKFLPYFHNMGARLLSEDLTTATGYVNSQEAVEAFQWLNDLVYKYHISNLEFGSPEAAFQAGQASIINREGWFAQDTLDKAPDIHFAVIPFVSGENVNLVADGAGSIWANLISAKTKYPEICQDIFKELAKPEYDVLMHEAAGFPPVLSATLTLDNEYFGRMPYAEAMLNSKEKDPAPKYDSIKQSGSIQILFGDTVAKVLGTPEIDVRTELDSLAVKIDQLLAQN
jgi:ABC-type glycerol-3-phosphate transport system substrate-binding protein